ncbi:hypothetical protein LR48_Vigan05g155100 [Vigna angularis]|uniref:Uncharacterized protein n=1 Tax=Phaseolus angularis TaxID=3914 RepID=A0A0L9UMN9_PHAAN|nr:hypothetical protein LR48_Vigan05g155100 [Vigna angularis]
MMGETLAALGRGKFWFYLEIGGNNWEVTGLGVIWKWGAKTSVIPLSDWHIQQAAKWKEGCAWGRMFTAKRRGAAATFRGENVPATSWKSHGPSPAELKEEAHGHDNRESSGGKELFSCFQPSKEHPREAIQILQEVRGRLGGNNNQKERGRKKKRKMEPEEKEDSTGEGSEPVEEDQVLDGSLQEVRGVGFSGC